MALATSSNRSILAISALAMGFSIISSAFNFYYVKVFLNIYGIHESWFQLSQMLYLIWNAINDPLFAYIQDTTNFRFTRTRRESILYTGPFFALSFIVPWFPWASAETTRPWIVGIHLMFSLCFWDTMFTYIGLAYCCIFTEISTDNAVRLKLIRYTQIGSLIGSSSTFILEYASGSLTDFFAFQMTTVVLAFCSLILFHYTGNNAYTEYDMLRVTSDKTENISHEKNLHKDSMLRLTLQIFTNKNFVSFVITNFFQEFHRAFLHGFLAIICDQLVQPDVVPTTVKSTFYGMVPLTSQLLVILCSPFVKHIGYFKTIRANFIWNISGGVFLFLLGTRNPWILMAFFLIDSCLTNSAYSLFNLPLSDVVDEDKAKYGRKHPITSMVYGTNALVVKPAISLSPMMVVAILNRYGYEDLKKNRLSAADVGGLNDVMFYLMCFFPFVLGIIQLISWSFFTTKESVGKDIELTVVRES